jgi:hypothetical protein
MINPHTLKRFAELLSQDLSREAIISRMRWRQPGQFDIALGRLCADLGAQAV